MKKLILFILLFATSYTYSQVKVGSEGGIIATGIYPVAKSNDIKSGVHTVQSIIERNSIPDNFRTVGMLAYVIDSLKYYQLKTGITNSDWYEFKGNGDTTLVELPMYVDTTGGVRTLKILHANGLVSGGIVTKGITDWAVDVTNAVYYINNKAYSSSSSTVTVDTSDATYDRIDVIAVDTTGNVIVISGTPSANPIAPQVNTASQLALTTITVKASSTSTSVTTKIIYDEGNEWDTATSGTITAHFLNEDNPYHSAYDIYVPTYENGGTLEFTDSDGDTVTSSMVLKYFLYLNGIVDRTFQVQFFNDDNPVSNSLSFSSGFGLDPNNASVYQNISIPLSSFAFSSSYFNKVKITMAGEDVSGANGYYLDYIQLQSGINYVQTDYSRAYVDFEISPDSTKLYAIRFNGGVDTLDWVGGGGIGGISQLGDPGFGMTKPNDSTYNLDTSDISTVYVRIKDSLSGYTTPTQLHDSIAANKITVITKSPLATYLKHGSDLYDSIGIRQASSTDSGYLSKEDWNKFNKNTRDTVRFIRKDSLGITPNTNFPFSSYIGLLLANYYHSVGSGIEASPAISMLGSWTQSVTGYHPAWVQMYATGSSAGGVLNIRTSEDSASWTSILTMSPSGATFPGGVLAQSFTASTGITTTGLSASNLGHRSILFGTSTGYTSPFALVEIKDTTKGFIINRGSTTARLKLGTNPFSATVTTPGSGYTGSRFDNAPVTGGSGTGGIIGVTISGGAVTSISSFGVNSGMNYRVGDVISASIPGGSGFTATITKLQGDTACGMQFYDTTLNRLYVWNCTNHYWDAMGPNPNSILTPTTGSTINVVRDRDYIINPAGTIAALTIALPSTPNNNDKVYLKFSQAVTTITYSGGTVAGAKTTAAAGDQWNLTYDLATSTWY